MRRNVVVAAAAAFVVLGAGTAAGAALLGPVDSAGVVHGCWTTGAVRGSHAFVLQDAGTACPRGTTAIQWNQTGPQGPQGTAGPTGTTGSPGKDGATVLSGTGAPTATVGHDGDFYIDTSTTTLYGPRAGGAWPTPGTSLVGPQGSPGTSGPHPFSLVATSANTDSNFIFNGSQAEAEAFCAPGPEFTLAHWLGNGPDLVVTGTLTPSAGATVTLDGGTLASGFLSFTDNVHNTFGVSGGGVTGTLLVTQGSSTFTITFAMTGGSQSCLSSFQITPTS